MQSVCSQAGCQDVRSRFQKVPQEAAKTLPRDSKMSPRSFQEIPECNQDHSQSRQDKHKIQRSRIQSVCNQAGCQDVRSRFQKVPQEAAKTLARDSKMSPRSFQESSKCNQDRLQRRQDEHKFQTRRLQSVCSLNTSSSPGNLAR